MHAEIRHTLSRINRNLPTKQEEIRNCSWRLIFSHISCITLGRMRSIVIGTAGHIDHGKTALVKALTGTDTDRLKEEKARGITIELGFAHMQLDADLSASIVDVPGHERFVRNMVAGTTGIDMVLMVVAADEAVMPQTREHLDICNILGVERGLVALTKVDLIDDPQWLDMVTQDLRTEFAGSFLAESPIIAVSSRTGQGMNVLKDALCNLGKKIPARSARASTFLAIDRAFTMRGFGTVVTGTLTSGAFRVEEQVDILPDPSEKLRGLKIRGLQVHNLKVEQAEAARRCAVNLSGIDHNLLSRGQVLTRTDSLRASTNFIGTLMLVPGTKILRSRTRAAFHTGTTRSLATVRLLNTDRLSPGEEAFVSIHCDTPVAALVQHRYILRGSSIIEGRGTTMGGGRILSFLPSRRTRKDKENWLRELECLRSGDDRTRLESFFRQAGPTLLDYKEISILSGLDKNSIAPILKDLVSKQNISPIEGDANRFIDTRALKDLAGKAEQILDVFHQKNPLLPGMPAEQLRQELTHKLEVRLFKSLLDHLSRQGVAVQQEEVVRLSRHKVQLSNTDSELEAKLKSIFIESKLAPPFVSEIAEQLQRRPNQVLDMLKHLSRSGFLVHISGQMFVSAEELTGLRANLIAFLEEHQEINIQDFKTLVNGSRKHVIPLAEYFDQEKTTLRVGQKRVLRKK